MSSEQDRHSIQVNGEAREVRSNTTLAEVLRGMDIDPEKAQGIAVAVNEEVVPKSEWKNMQLDAEAEVEVITARQGG